MVGEADFWGGVAARLAAAKPASWGTAAAGPAGAGGLPGRRRLGLSNILQRVEVRERVCERALCESGCDGRCQ